MAKIELKKKGKVVPKGGKVVNGKVVDSKGNSVSSTSSKSTTTTSKPTTSTPRTNAEILADAQKQLQNIQKGLDEGVKSGQIKTNAQVEAEKAGIVQPEVLTPESIANAVADASPKTEQGATVDDVEETDTFQEGEGTYQTQADGSAILVGGQGQSSMSRSQATGGGQGNLSTPSVVDYLSSIGQATDFNSRKNLAGQYGIQGYTGSAQQNTQLLGALRGAPITPQEQITPTSAGAITETAEAVPPQGAVATNFATLAEKYGLTQTKNDFDSDPLKTIGDITKQVFSAMGVGDANKEIKNISEELEDLENQRDDEIREINDDPWLTEGVRLRQIQKAEAKWADKIDNRVNKLQLLESVRDDAQQQAQFALGTAISIYDSERRFQADQIQQYYDQAQREFDNQIKLAQLSAKDDDRPNSVKEWLFAVENGETRSYGEWTNPVKTTGSGSGGGTGGGGIVDATTGKSLKLTAPQVDTLSGFENIFSSADTAISLLNNGVKTGPIEGSLLQGAKTIGKGDANQLKLEQILGKLKADYMKALSGAAVSDAEVIRLSKFLPDIYDQENVILSKLNTLKETALQQKNNYLKTLGGTDTNANSGYDAYLQSIGQ